MIFDRTIKDGPPIQKISLKVKPLADGGAKLVIMKKKPKGKKLPGAATPQPTEGKFTLLVKKKRGK
jgi:hypothetical protein